MTEVMDSSFQEPIPISEHTMYFDSFRVGGAIHLETRFTFQRNGKWKAYSKIKTAQTSFRPVVSLSLEFFMRDTGYQVPIANDLQDWGPKELWRKRFQSQEERQITCAGTSKFLAGHFDQLVNEGEGKLRMGLSRKKSLLRRLLPH